MTIPQRPRQEEKAGAVLTVFRCRFRLRASCANVLNNWGTPKLQDCQRIQTTSEYLGRILGGISNSLSWQMITWFLEFSAGKWRKRLPKRRGSWNSWALSTPRAGRSVRTGPSLKVKRPRWDVNSTCFAQKSALDWSQFLMVEVCWSHIFNILCPVKSMDCAWNAMQCTVRLVLVVVTAGCREEAKRKGALVGDSGWGLVFLPWWLVGWQWASMVFFLFELGFSQWFHSDLVGFKYIYIL